MDSQTPRASRDATASSDKSRAKQLARWRLFEDPPPLIAERYRIQEFLGRGGLGDVYRAHDVRLDRAVALKFVRHARGTDGGAQQLLNEALTLARVSHQGIVPIYDVGGVGGELFIAMELLLGETLEHAIVDNPLPWRELLPIAEQIAEALAAAHASGIVHGDVKPANVMLHAGGRVRLLDFGLAREASRGPESSDDARTRPSGTPGYLAPERHAGILDAQCDQFAFWVSIHRALFARFPFGDGWAPASRDACDSWAPPSKHVGAAPPRWLIDALRRGLAFEAKDRFPSMAAVHETLAAGRLRRRRAPLLAITAAAVLTFAVVQARDAPTRCTLDGPTVVDRSVDWISDREVGDRLQAELQRFDAERSALAQGNCDALTRDAISGVLYDLRTACADRARSAVEFALQRSAEAAFENWRALVPAVEELGDLAACRDDAALLDGRPSEGTDEDIATSIGRGLDQAYVHMLLGDAPRYLDALVQVERDHADIARAPQSTLWLVAHLGSALNQNGRSEEAVAQLEPALLAARRWGHWRRIEGAILVTLSEAKAALPGAAHEAVFLAEQAIATLDGASSTQPFAAAAHRAHAAALLASGDAQASLDALGIASTYPRVPSPSGFEPVAGHAHEAAIANLAGLALERLGRLAEAERRYRDGLAALPDALGPSMAAARLHNNLGLLLADTGRLDEAERELVAALAIKRTLRLAVEVTGTLLNLGYLETRRGALLRAIARYDEALAVVDDPALRAKIFFNRGVALQDGARPADARADFDSALALADHPRVPAELTYGARLGRGVASLALGDAAQARIDLEAALRSEPSSASSWDRAELRLSLAQLTTAENGRTELVRQALALAEKGGHASLAGRARVALAAEL